MKPAIVTDSNSGITQAQARELGIFVLPMPVIIDGTVYYEDVDLTAHQFFQALDHLSARPGRRDLSVGPGAGQPRPAGLYPHVQRSVLFLCRSRRPGGRL